MSDLRRSAPRRLRFLALTLVLGHPGCADSPTVPDPTQFSASPNEQWAGGPVTVTASGGAFEVGDVIARGSDTLAVVEGRVQSVALRVPADANGPTTLSVSRAGRSLGDVVLEAYGFEGLRVYPGLMSDMISDFPVPNGVSVVARRYEEGCCGDTGGGFVWIYPSTGQHRAFASTPDLADLFRVGVDPLVPEVYYEYRFGTESECVQESNCDLVHRARIVGGDLVDLGWVERPCNRWGCQPLVGDTWIALDGALTCQVVPTPNGETCEYINSDFNADDPLGLEYLWSEDVALLLGPSIAIRISTGEKIYSVPEFSYSVAVDETRGLFYLSARILERLDESMRVEILAVRGDDGSEERTFGLTLTCPGDSSGPTSCSEPDLAYDEARDLLYLLRSDTRTLEARDPVTFELLGQVALPVEVGDWYFARVLVDDFTKHVFIVLASATLWDPGFGDYRPASGTPVVEIRLPPP